MPDDGPVTIEPEDVERVARIVGDLPDAASEEEARAAVRAEFPDVDVVAARRESAELVVAVGVVWARDCVVVVRPDGEAPVFRFTDFDRVLLEPGELGCTPYLYLAPVTTH